MSKLFEALTRGQDALPGILLDPLLEGEAPVATPQAAAGPAPARPSAAAPSPVASAPAVRLPAGMAPGTRSVRLRVPPSSPILPFDGSHWRAGEQYRMLRTKIIQHPAQPRVLLVTSAGPGDGKSVTVINLAGALALKSEARVLLLDGDFRRSTIAKQLGVPNTLGLANILGGEGSLEDAIVQAEQIPNLFILPAGTANMNPAELLDSRSWARVCAECRANFEYVVIDGPPLGAVTDYDLLQSACDGVIMVARPDQTDRRQCLKTLEAIPKSKLLGMVLNCVSGWLLHKERQYPEYYYSPQGGK